MLHTSQYGQRGQKPETSAISGRPLSPEDVYLKVNGYRIGVKAVEWRGMSLAEQDAVRAGWGSQLPSTPGDTDPARPNYETMSFEDLKALAQERSVDLSGRRSKAEVIQALRADDVSARFADAVDSSHPLDLSTVVGE